VVSVCLVTGGAGFIGRELVFQLYERGHHIVVVDKGTYAARFDLIRTFRDRLLVWSNGMSGTSTTSSAADVVFHLAAESHVDNSITDGGKFVESNVGGTLPSARTHPGGKAPRSPGPDPRLHR
jgi:dTDP-glucose 4,6-dehydratase